MACFSSCNGLNTPTSFDSFVALNAGCGAFPGFDCFSGCNGCGGNNCGCGCQSACCNPCGNPCGNTCGCPSGCLHTHVTLTGTVMGVGGPVNGLPIQYTVNGQTQTTTTNANGTYSIVVPVQSTVSIAPQVGLGVTVTPPTRTVNVTCSGQSDLNFTLTPVTLV